MEPTNQKSIAKSIPQIKYRRMRESDHVEAQRMVVRALNHLRKKANLSKLKARVTAPWPILLHFFRSDPEGHFVAVDEQGRIVGYASAIVRESEWYLTMLFVMPTHQTKGVGQKLLNRSLKYGEKSGCTRRALATFSYNPQAVAVYTKAGMPPQAVCLMMERKRTGKNHKKVRPGLKLSIVPIDDEAKVNRFGRLDRKIRGVARPEEFFHWLAEDIYQILEFRDGRKFAGYAVINKNGGIGPVAAASPAYLESMLAYCLNHKLLSEAKLIRINPLGENSSVLELLLSAGFRIQECTLVMASERFSDPTRYLPGNLAHY